MPDDFKGTDLQLCNRDGQQTALAALSSLLEAAGLNASDLATAITALGEAKQTVKAKEQESKSIFQDKENIYDDEDAFIYRRGDTKKKIYYLRIYDGSSKKPYVKSLSTTDRTKAITTARLLYQEIIGKIDRGERLKSPTPDLLISEYLKDQEKRISRIPRQGITPEAFKLKKYHLNNWRLFLLSQRLCETTIDRVEPDKTKNYGFWLLGKPKKDGTPRSRENINNAIAEIKRMYRYAIEQKYISTEKAPKIERVGEQPDDGHKRDIFTLSEYEKHWKFLERQYIKDKDIEEEEKQKRIIFSKVWGILMNTGMRPKEILGLKIKEISSNPHITNEDERKKQVVITIRAENSKTGRSRKVVAPIKKRIEVILKAYKAIGITHSPEDFLLISPTSKTREAYTRQAIYQRLKATLEQSGLADEMATEGKTISLYSARHTYITWRLRYGGVPIHLLAKQTGTSVEKIEKTYGHIEVEKQAEEITKAQGQAIRIGVDFTSILDNAS